MASDPWCQGHGRAAGRAHSLGLTPKFRCLPGRSCGGLRGPLGFLDVPPGERVSSFLISDLIGHPPHQTAPLAPTPAAA